MHTFQSLSKGNPGAMRFLMELANPKMPIRTLSKIERSGIVGSNLYVLWSDLCNCDMDKVVKLVADCPLDVLKDACGRQDYSGRELVVKYWPTEDKTKSE